MTLNRPGILNIGILGSGFGLYGYLPAIVNNKTANISLLKKDKEKFSKRAELQRYAHHITWLEKRDLLEQVNTLIICLTPDSQPLLVKQVLKLSNIKFLVLEKPLALNPARSTALLDALTRSGKRFRIGYNFQYTNWGRNLIKCLDGETPAEIKIEWNFMANHYAKDLNNWKRYTNSGGGAIRFYGIHMFALLSNFKNCVITNAKSFDKTKNDTYRLTANFIINKIHAVQLDINTYSEKTDFNINILTENGASNLELTDPFGEFVTSENNLDKRVNVIKPLLKSFKDNPVQEYWNDLYRKTNDLWLNIEATISYK